MSNRLLRQQFNAFRQQFQAAVDIFEIHPGFPAAQVRLIQGTQELRRKAPPRASRHGTPERFELVASVFDLQCETYLELIDNMELQKSYMTLITGFKLAAMEQYSGFSPAEIQFAGISPQELLFAERASHWIAEGYKRLIPAETKPVPDHKPPKKGFRAEVNTWMEREDIETIERAAKELGVSETTLKSIMSDKV